MKRVLVSAAFDDIKSRDIRFLQEASKLGDLHVHLWSDATVERATGSPPAFPLAERLYMVQAVRFVGRVTPLDDTFSPGMLPDDNQFDILASDTEDEGDRDKLRIACADTDTEFVHIAAADLKGFPVEDRPLPEDGRTVLVTGCFDWFHSGHVRFFEEVSAIGRLYVVVGHDENVRLLKGEGHPLFPEDERRYMCDSIRYVHQAFVSTGHGWLDAEPEILRLAPDMYAVNEDGDKPEKRQFCEENGIEYVVLKRTPKEGLERRSSTDLRGY